MRLPYYSAGQGMKMFLMTYISHQKSGGVNTLQTLILLSTWDEGILTQSEHFVGWRKGETNFCGCHFGQPFTKLKLGC